MTFHRGKKSPLPFGGHEVPGSNKFRPCPPAICKIAVRGRQAKPHPQSLCAWCPLASLPCDAPGSMPSAAACVVASRGKLWSHITSALAPPWLNEQGECGCTFYVCISCFA